MHLILTRDSMLYRIKYCFAILYIVFAVFSPVHAVEENPILIISSYNPDSHNTATNISEFIEEYRRLDGNNNVIIENMNCRSFSESRLWKERMRNILNKYKDENSPQFIILLGQEAWASYLSQERISPDIPVLCAMVSRNGIILPDDTVNNLKSWMPEAIDFLVDEVGYTIRGGFVYEYDIDRNIRFIKDIYPNTKHIAFISDNTYGGVSIQSYFVREMKKHPELDYILLDGRSNTIYTIVEKLRNLPAHTAVILGTWRIDENDGYFMRNATYTMMEAIPDVPVFSLTTLGFGYWAIGGIMPVYRDFGKDMAKQVIEMESAPENKLSKVVFIGNNLRVDYKKMEELGLSSDKLPSDAIVINKTISFYEQYKYEIWIITSIFFGLIITLVILLYFYYRTRKLTEKLRISENHLRVAKEKAEESNHLKSAFLANMSHEIRTPLNAIVGFSNVLITEDISAEEREAYFEIIRSNSNILLRLINDILDLSRLETNMVNFEWEEQDLVQLSKQALASVEHAKKTTNKFIFKSKYTTFAVPTDAQRFQQVLINLLSNADKFTTDGTIWLELDAEIKKNKVIISVSDTGKGIPKDKQTVIFDRFEKLDEYVQGTGLGLAICKLIVMKWGGQIWVDPSYKKGAKFMFTFPITK